MKLAIGCDRNGFDYKNRLVEYLTSKGHEVIDVGTKEYVPCDSPYFASKVGKLVASGECQYGILLCATGTGMTIAANKIPGVMCGMGYGDEVTKLMREHNDANVLCMGARVISEAKALEITDIFLDTPFSKDERHIRRISKIEQP